MSVTYQPGEYLADVLSHGFETSKTGKPMISIRVGIGHRIENEAGADGVIRENFRPVQRYERTVRVVINEENEQSLDIKIKQLRFAGFTGDSLADLRLDDQVRVTCKHQTYNGAPSENWDLALPPREQGPSDPSLARRMDAIFGKRLKDGAKAPAPRPAAPTSAGDDDIPF